MDTVDVSVILPCYNVERYVDQALTSAELNDRISLEILAVNDGSRDGSLDILRAHAARDSRVRIVDKPNSGYGASMNRGISEARGTYIAILEPDDWVNPHAYDELYEYACSFSELPDIVKSPYTRIWMPDTHKEHPYHCAYYKRIDPGFQPFTLADAPRLMRHHPSIWSALYKKSFLVERHIRFKEIPGAGWVDNPFMVETLCQAETIVYKDKPYYNYREDLPTSSSATRTSLLPLERWMDMCDVCDRLNIEDEGIRNALTYVGLRYVSGLVGEESHVSHELREATLQVLRRMGRRRILADPDVAPALKRTCLELIGETVPHMSSSSYRRFLIQEFFYTWKTNGITFALSRIRLYFERIGIIKSLADPSNTHSASI